VPLDGYHPFKIQQVVNCKFAELLCLFTCGGFVAEDTVEHRRESDRAGDV
jgi:hypothetical protein